MAVLLSLTDVGIVPSDIDDPGTRERIPSRDDEEGDACLVRPRHDLAQLLRGERVQCIVPDGLGMAARAAQVAPNSDAVNRPGADLQGG